MSSSISRRSLLKWLGAGAVAAPLAMSLRSPRRLRAAAGDRPRRMIIFYTPHGAPAEFFWPTSATNYASQGGQVSILEKLQPLAGKINVIRGMNYIGSDNHYANRDVLTNKGPDSVETVVARKLGQQPLRLGVCPDYPGSFTVDGYLSFDGGTPQQHKADPAAIFDNLVSNLPSGGGGGGGPTGPVGPSIGKLRAQSLNVTDAELRELRERLGGSQAGLGLTKHADAIGQMKIPPDEPAQPDNPVEPPAQCSSKPTFASVEKVRGKNVFAAENMSDVMDAQLDNAVFALTCGLSRVVSIQSGFVNYNIPFTWIGQQTGHHQLSHNSPGSPGRVEHAQAQYWFAEKFASLLTRLNVTDPEDPDHTILDNTVALWCSEIADGQAHNCQSIPLVLAGGGGGYLKTGQYLQLNNRGHAELLLAIAGAMNVTDANFGQAPGPLAEVRA